MYILVCPAKTDRPIIFGVGNATCTSRLITPARLHTTLVDLAVQPTLYWCNDLHLLPHCEHNTEMQLHYYPAHIILGHLHSTGLIYFDPLASCICFHSLRQLITLNQEYSSTIDWESTSDHTSSCYTSSLIGYSICITAILTAMIQYSFNLSGKCTLSTSTAACSRTFWAIKAHNTASASHSYLNQDIGTIVARPKRW